jgi:NADH-quinone oxidoreductase subunit C
MTDPFVQFRQDLLDNGIQFKETNYNARGFHLEAILKKDQVRRFAEKAYVHGFYLVFVAGYHVRPHERENETASGFEVVYQFARHDRLCRVKGQASVPEDMSLPSICDIYQGANWHERETRDLFGIVFEGHPNLKPLLLAEEDLDFHPLLKAEDKLKALQEVSWSPAAPNATGAADKTKTKASSADEADS